MNRIILVTVVIFISGCQTYWKHESGYSSSWERDKYNCEMEAARAYPVRMVTQSSGRGYTTDSTTNCSSYGNITNCTTTPGQYIPPQKYTEDVNQGNRNLAVPQCLRASGWRQCQSKDSC